MMKNFFAWLQIVRFPNVFTIVADALTAGALTYYLRDFPVVLAVAFTIASVGAICLYWSGMILNDAYDAEEDAALRVNRPIPSGRISRKTAFRVGWGLWVGGLALCLTGGVTGFLNGTGISAVFFVSAILLAVCIWLYDAEFKNTPVGPFLMGMCRGLNILMLLSFRPMSELAASPLLLYPLALTIYITGVTFYARGETEEAPEVGIHRPGVVATLFSLLLMAGGIALLVPFPSWLESWMPGSVTALFVMEPWRWVILISVLALWLVFRAFSAYFQGPLRVRIMVKLALFTVFLLDAGLVAVVGGIPAAMMILACFAIASVIGRWVYST
ncbi:MAG: UbiA family prenyltransferase [Planctomycetia bacterium]|nr:UbiA family prenyltransferase [Planctomycetia bacterium]